MRRSATGIDVPFHIWKLLQPLRFKNHRTQCEIRRKRFYRQWEEDTDSERNDPLLQSGPELLGGQNDEAKGYGP